MARHYTITSGVVYRHTVLEGVEEHDEGKDFAESEKQLIAGARAVAVQLEGHDLQNREATLKIRTSLDGGETWRLHRLLIETGPTSNGLDYIEEKTLSSSGRNLTYLAPETLGALTHIKARLEITDTDNPEGYFNVKVTIAY